MKINLRSIAIVLLVALWASTARPSEAIDLLKLNRSISKEPEYRSEYQEYCLLAINAEKDALIWCVRDGADMYVDLNGNGDLTENGEKFVGVYKADATNGDRKLALSITPSKKVFGTAVKHLSLVSYDHDPVGQWRIRAEFNGNDRREFSRPFQTARLAKHAPIIHLNGPVTVVAYLDRHRYFHRNDPATSIKYARGQEYSLILRVGNVGVGKGAQVHCESEDLSKLLTKTIVEGRLSYVDKNGKVKETTHRFEYERDDDP